MNDYARIVTFEEFDQLRDSLGRIVCTSGGFDPLHEWGEFWSQTGNSDQEGNE